MTPILYPARQRQFNNGGAITKLTDAITCNCEEERNGIYEISLEIPADSPEYQYIDYDMIILTKPSQGAEPQPFRIYSISEPLDGVIEIRAEHVSYALAKIAVMPFTANSCSEALTGLKTNAATVCSFNFWTDKAVTKEYKVEEPRYIRELLGGTRNSILDVYGTGEYEFDNYNVKLWTNRGRDRGVTIKYGKNLTDFRNEIDTENVYTGILPFWTNAVILENGGSGDAETVTLPEKVVLSSHASDYADTKIKIVDFSSKWEEKPTVEQLREAAQDYVENNQGWNPKQNIALSFVNLYDTEEYKNERGNDEQILLCDTITVIYEKYQIKQKVKVIKTVFDCLNERYIEIEVGDPRTNFGKAIADRVETTDNSQIEGNINAIQGEINTIRADVTGISQDVSQLRTDVSDIKTRLTTAEGNISTNTNDISDLKGRMTTAEQNIAGLDSDIDGLVAEINETNGEVRSLKGRMNTAEGNISTNAGNISTNAGKIQDLNDWKQSLVFGNSITGIKVYRASAYDQQTGQTEYWIDSIKFIQNGVEVDLNEILFTGYGTVKTVR